MKRIFTFFFALLAACTFSAYAAVVDGTCGDNLTWTLNTKDSTLVVSGTGEMANYPSWSDYKIYIKYVTLPDGLTSIGDEAFLDCSSLTSITIPNNVTSIGDHAFEDCSGLTSVTIGSGVTSIGEYAFRDCSSLTSITIPNSVTSIGDWAFSYCYGLTSPVYNAHCFAYMPTSYKGAYIIPEGIKQIAGGAFLGCKGLTSITIPNSVTTIGSLAFSNCSGLTSIIVEDANSRYDSRDNCNAIIEIATNTLIAGCQNTIIPSSVTSIGDHAFCGCYGLTSITIPNSVTTIEDEAFQYCSSLTSITIPNSVTYIGFKAFLGCEGLTSITIPNSVTTIGSYAFRSCKGLTSIIVEDANSRYDSRDNCNAIIETATNTLIAGCQNTIIPNSVTSIGRYVFLGCYGLTSITIPSSVTSIEYGAFKNCSSLTSIKSLAEVPPTLGTDVFYKVSNNIPVYVRCGTVSAYQSAEGWKDFTNIQCMPEDESAVDNVHSQSTNCQKILRNGQLLIIRDGVEYNAMGVEL